MTDKPRDQVIGPVGIESGEQVGTPTLDQAIAPVAIDPDAPDEPARKVTLHQPGIATEKDEAFALPIASSGAQRAPEPTDHGQTPPLVDGRVAADITDDLTATAVAHVDNNASSTVGNLQANLTAGAVVSGTLTPAQPTLPPAPQIIPGSSAEAAPGGPSPGRVGRVLRAERGEYVSTLGGAAPKSDEDGASSGPNPATVQDDLSSASTRTPADVPLPPLARPPATADQPAAPRRQTPAEAPIEEPRQAGRPVPIPPTPTTSGTTSGSQARSGASSVQADPPTPPDARVESTSDSPTKDDCLGFAPYVEAVSEFLLNPATTTPFAMSIEAAWGAGKSSFLAQLAVALVGKNPSWWSRVRRRLSHAEKGRTPRKVARVVTFNPWRHETDQSLWASFALEFVKQCKPALLGRPWAALKYAALRFNLAEGWRPLLLFGVACCAVLVAPLLPYVPAAIEWLFPPTWLAAAKAWKVQAMKTGGLVTLILAAVRTHKAALDAKLRSYLQRPDYEAKVSFLTSFREDLEAYVSTHVGVDERVFVLVDDLDRCDPLQAAQLLKAINLMVPDTLPIVFLVAIDRRKVAAGIAVAHEKAIPLVVDERDPAGKLDPDVAVSYGYEFLEKFFQLPFRLPRTGAESFRPFVESLIGTALPRPTGAAGRKSNTAPRSPRTLQDVATDNSEVGEIVLELASFLSFSPRRAKQLLNLFRLRHYVLQSLGRLGTAGAPTLRQLGRIVALEIGWPRFVESALQRPELLEALETVALHPPVPDGTSRPDLAPWFGKTPLITFLGEARSEDRIGGLDLGELLGASASPAPAPTTHEVTPATAVVKQSATVDAKIRRADGSEEDVDLSR